MAGPQDFMAPVPSLRVDTAPMLAIGQMLSQAPLNAAKSYEAGKDIAARNAFSGGIPLDANGKPDMQAIISKTFQAGGVPAVQALMPYIIYMGGLNNTGAYKDLNPDAGQAPSQQQQQAGQFHPAGAGPDNIDPGRQSAEPRITGSGTKDDPYVIPNQGGLQFFQQSQNFPAGSVWKLGEWTGVKGQPSATRSGQGPTPPLGKVSVAMRNGPESAQPTAGPENTAEGQTVSSGAARATPAEMADARQRLTQGMTGGDGGGVSGAPGPVATPGSAAPQSSRGGSPVPRPNAPPSPEDRLPPIPPGIQTQRPPIPFHDASAGDPTIADLQARQNKLGEDIANWGRTNGPMKVNQGAIEAATQQINNMQKAIDNRREVLNKPFEKLNEAHAQGFPSVQAKEAFEEATKKASDAGQKQLEAINGYAAQIAQDLGPHIETGLELLNSGKLYTGFGAETMMEFNRAKQLWGDRGAATPQEAFEKTVSAIRLGMSNGQRFMAQMGGQAASRIFAQQINEITKASASLGNTVAGNRFLLETARRSTEQMYDIQKMASKYITAGHFTLDQGFNQMVTDYLRKNPLYKTDLERANPEKFMAAPQVPKQIAKDAEKNSGVLEKWQHDIGAKPGDPIRKADGSGYFKALTLTVPKRGTNIAPEQVPSQVPGR